MTVSSAMSPVATVNGECRLGRGVFMGSQAVVAPRVVVGDNAKLSAGAVVSADVPAGSLMVGNPARGRVVFPTLWGLNPDGP